MLKYFVAGTLAFLCQQCFAKDVAIDGKTIITTPGAGQCDVEDFSDLKPLRYEAIRTTPAGMSFLGMYVNCKEATQQRGKGYISLKSTYTASIAGPNDTIASVCADLRKRYGSHEIFDRSSQDAFETIASTLEEGSTASFGVLEERPAVCYAGTVRKFMQLDGTPATELSIVSIILFRGHLVYYYDNAPYRGKYSIEGTLSVHRANLANFLVVNKY